MDAGVFIALINPGMGLIFASAFAILWHHQRQRRHVAFCAAGFFAMAVAFLLQYFSLIGETGSKLLSNMLFVAAAIALVHGALDRYGRRPPMRALLLVGAVALVAFCWFFFVEPDLSWRIYVMNFAFGAMALLLATELRKVPNRKLLDNFLMGLVVFWGVSFFPRPIVVLWLDGPYATYEQFHESLYWITLVFSGSLFMLLFALIMITATALDVMDELRQQTRTDPLSRLLNRRGFEEGMGTAFAQRNPGTAATLIVCDIDHFKSVNDRFGHAGGDLVIERFAQCLRAAAEGQHLAGRIGGEEFALLLDNADRTTARLFAEGVRIAFSQAAVPGMPEGTRITASFGVAEAAPGETAASLFRRADKALYEAKDAGRNCVRVSGAQGEQLLRAVG